ncbi:hypothetical protein RXV86_10325 [Alisedimentitalea sp. MJ-SS2]|uniref:hypothetical protein n=1 Tax=Aliisedimentitalea sp. MJ-SS2 TaxID=3049795 RepID=UPI00290F27E3|nr:hypothetical protein [Alisedimentitalea sp. MJ-SS2]MDU8927779.1 hypothetical protein [Alisedimentitalea sp. MJ-SS2]
MMDQIRSTAKAMVVALVGIGSAAHAQTAGQGTQMHGHGHMQHDEVNMPGLRGKNATKQESAELAVMFRNFQAIERSVEDLPDGIRAVTFSKDPELMEVLISHVVGMIDRVEMGNDPQIIIQSPTLDILFERRETLTTDVDITDEGIVVTQTSSDPEVVAALHLHAHEVTRMSDQGMHAVHMMMMERQAQN